MTTSQANGAASENKTFQISPTTLSIENKRILDNYWSITADDRRNLIHGTALYSAHCNVDNSGYHQRSTNRAHGTGESSSASSRNNSVSVNRRVKKFLFENILTKRTRTISTNIPTKTTSPTRKDSELYKISHAHTITANDQESKMILKEIGNLKDLPLSIDVRPLKSSNSSKKISNRIFQVTPVNNNGINNNEDEDRKLKKPVFDRFFANRSLGLSRSPSNKVYLNNNYDDSICPDPSKLPKEYMPASLEFSKSSLGKSERRKFPFDKIGLKNRKKKEKNSPEEVVSPPAISFNQNFNKMIIQHHGDASLFDALTLDIMTPFNLTNEKSTDILMPSKASGNLMDCKAKSMSASYSTGFQTGDFPKKSLLLPSIAHHNAFSSRFNSRTSSGSTPNSTSSMSISNGSSNNQSNPNILLSLQQISPQIKTSSHGSNSTRGSHHSHHAKNHPANRHHPHGNSSGHHHSHHHRHYHHYHHRHHHHHQNQHHKEKSNYTHIMENERYLLLKSAKPFRSLEEYKNTRGKGLGDNKAYLVLFQHTLCYDLIPNNAQLITIDSQLSIGKAFRALISNGIRCAPVWDSSLQTFTSMLTVSDFVQMLNTCMNPEDNSYIEGDGCKGEKLDIDELEKLSVQRWKEIRNGQQIKSNMDEKSSVKLISSLAITQDQFLAVDPEDSIFKALRKLFRMRIHYIPIIDSPVTSTGNPLFVLNHHCLLSFLYKMQKNLPRPDFLNLSLEETGLHIQKEITVITMDNYLSETIRIFKDHQISAIPVVNNLQEKKLLTIFAKFDVVILALNGSYKNPELKISEGIHIRDKILAKNKIFKAHPGVEQSFSHDHRQVEICLPSDTVQDVLDKLIKTGVHRLVVIDTMENHRVIGIISMSDLLYFMVLKQARRYLCKTGHSTAVPEEAVNFVMETSSSSENLENSASSDEYSDSTESTRSSFSSSVFTSVQVSNPKQTISNPNHNSEEDGVEFPGRAKQLFQVETLTNMTRYDDDF